MVWLFCPPERSVELEVAQCPQSECHKETIMARPTVCVHVCARVPPEWAGCDDRGPSVVAMRLSSVFLSQCQHLRGFSHACTRARRSFGPTCFVSVQRPSAAGSFCFHQNGAALSVGVSSRRLTFSSEGRILCKIHFQPRGVTTICLSNLPEASP